MKHYTLARPYAKAAYLFAKEADKLKTWTQFLEKMAALVDDETMQAILKHPQFNAQILIDLAVEKLGDNDVRHFQNFLMLLHENRRLALLPEIYELFLEDVKGESAAREVSVKSAAKLSKAEITALRAKLASQFNQPVDLEIIQDASLIGGMIIESGDYVMDSSLQGQLQRLKQELTL